MDWMSRPTVLSNWPENVSCIMGMDENGTSDLVSIRRKLASNNEAQIDESIKDFTLTGVVLNKTGVRVLKDKFSSIKHKYWQDGMCDYKGELKRVCFHSREIRKKEYPFSIITNYDEFMQDITDTVSSLPTKIFSCYVDKKKHFLKYKTPDHPYHIAVRYILERYCNGLNSNEQKGIVMLESRGNKEDKFVLKHILEIINSGTNQNRSYHFRNLAGVYFNPKWVNKESTHSILELADLISFPVHKFARNGCGEEFKDLAFKTIESKFYKYPNYQGWGLKVFP